MEKCVGCYLCLKGTSQKFEVNKVPTREVKCFRDENVAVNERTYKKRYDYELMMQWSNTYQDYEFTTQERVGKTLITDKMIVV